MTALDPLVPAISPTDSSGTPDRMFHALCGLSLLATVLGVGQHLSEALGALMPAEGDLATRLGAVPTAAWIYAALHLAAGVASLGFGYLAISLAYPRRGLAREARTNPAAAIQASAHLMGAAVIATVSWGGSDAHSLLVSAVFCLLGWIAVMLIGAGHRLLTRYRDHEEIAAGNTAAALASAGMHLGVALVVGHAIQGQFTGWSGSLRGFALALVWVLALYPLRQIVLARLILRLTPRAMDAAIAAHRDHWLGASEAVCYVLSALCLSSGG